MNKIQKSKTCVHVLTKGIQQCNGGKINILPYLYVYFHSYVCIIVVTCCIKKIVTQKPSEEFNISLGEGINSL